MARPADVLSFVRERHDFLTQLRSANMHRLWAFALLACTGKVFDSIPERLGGMAQAGIPKFKSLLVLDAAFATPRLCMRPFLSL